MCIHVPGRSRLGQILPTAATSAGERCPCMTDESALPIKLFVAVFCWPTEISFHLVLLGSARTDQKAITRGHFAVALVNFMYGSCLFWNGGESCAWWERHRIVIYWSFIYSIFIIEGYGIILHIETSLFCYWWIISLQLTSDTDMYVKPGSAPNPLPHQQLDSQVFCKVLLSVCVSLPAKAAFRGKV